MLEQVGNNAGFCYPFVFLLNINFLWVCNEGIAGRKIKQFAFPYINNTAIK
jgi:hypothetical protein